ncbi:MAG: response regulator [Syntrophobacteraceae bacterium CG2_30_61_12]|nr:MAG: response regulator [Syntrophobacteraceae bacterium CG2_30_61_12]PIU30782.1 MAG: response regulator [Syntrophobacteraceae bacterium CG07_land_8_20_14_0_80_61_8]
MRVLLVDDEIELVSTLAERLTLRGFQVDWFAAPLDALAAVRDNPYDVAVLDVKIPKMGGLELKKEMERLQPKLRFIFMTGHGSLEDFEAGVDEAGAGFYLVKPVNIEVLTEKIRQLSAEEGNHP